MSPGPATASSPSTFSWFAEYRSSPVCLAEEKKFQAQWVTGLPSQIGSLVWRELHQRAARLYTEEQELACICFLKLVCQNFSCSLCRQHCSSYLDQHPPTAARGILVRGRRLGLFLYLWRFHNDVNCRLGKPFYPLSQALRDQNLLF